MARHQIITTPAGEQLVILPLADYEAMQDAHDAAVHAVAMAAVHRGEIELLTPEDVLASLAAPTPLAFWRGKRGLTQKALATAAGISQSYIADLEAGRRKGDPALFKRLATALHVRMEDLIDD